MSPSRVTQLPYKIWGGWCNLRMQGLLMLQAEVVCKPSLLWYCPIWVILVVIPSVELMSVNTARWSCAKFGLMWTTPMTGLFTTTSTKWSDAFCKLPRNYNLAVQMNWVVALITLKSLRSKTVRSMHLHYPVDLLAFILGWSLMQSLTPKWLQWWVMKQDTFCKDI